MALISHLPLAEVAAITARALEESLGHDAVLATGTIELGAPGYDALPDAATRTVVLPFSDGIVGEVTLVVDERFATVLEAAAPDGLLATAARPALLAAAAAIAVTTDAGIDPDDVIEVATDTLLTAEVGEFAAAPLFEADTRVACLVVRILDEAHHATSSATVAQHEFRTLEGTSGVETVGRPLSLLNDVAMEVTAELGRRRLKVRDIATLQPGSVLELDRAAGSPVEVLVNGAIVWRGEVVVVDDDLGVRVSEVVTEAPASTPGTS